MNVITVQENTMKPTTRALGALAAAALLLTGCTASSEPDPKTHTPSSEADTDPAPAERATPVIDIAEAKAAALADGRPEPAWDENCVAWEMPDPDTDPLAFQATERWLEMHDSDCPDAIVYPYYYVDGFRDGDPGEVIVDLDPEAGELADATVSDSHLQHTAYDILWSAVDSGLQAESVTAVVPGSDLTHTVNREFIEDKRSLGYDY